MAFSSARKTNRIFGSCASMSKSRARAAGLTHQLKAAAGSAEIVPGFARNGIDGHWRTSSTPIAATLMAHDLQSRARAAVLSAFRY